MKGYLRKITKPHAYVRLIKGKSDMHLIRGTLASAVRQVRRIGQELVDRFSKRSAPDHERFNSHFWDAFQVLMRRRKQVLFLLCEIDNETPDFNHEFRTKVLDRHPEYLRFCTIKELPNADHSLVFEDGRRASGEALLEWLG